MTDLSLDGLGKTHDRVRGVDGASGRVMVNYLGLKALSVDHPFSVNFSCLVQMENVADDVVFALLDAAEGAILPITFPIVYGKDIFLNRSSDNTWSIAEEGLREKVVRFYERAVELSESGGIIVDNGAFYRHVLSQLKGAPRTLPCLFRAINACRPRKWSQSRVLPSAELAYETGLSAGSIAILAHGHLGTRPQKWIPHPELHRAELAYRASASLTMLWGL